MRAVVECQRIFGCDNGGGFDLVRDDLTLLMPGRWLENLGTAVYMEPSNIGRENGTTASTVGLGIQSGESRVIPSSVLSTVSIPYLLISSVRNAAAQSIC